MKKIHSVFIVGTPYSGSTVVGEYLNNYKNTLFVGELARFETLHKNNLLYEQPSVCLSCALNNNECPIFNHKLSGKLNNVQPLAAHKIIAKATNSAVIIDGSKFVDWLRIATASKEINDVTVRAIICVKNPFSFVESCLAREENNSVPIYQLANLWRDTYFDCLRTISKNNLPFLVLRNEDFSNGNSTLYKNILTFANSDIKRKKQLHAIGSNPGVLEGRKYSPEFLQKIENSKQFSYLIHREFLKKGKIKRFKKSKLSVAQKLEVLQTPGLVDLATVLGYDLLQSA